MSDPNSAPSSTSSLSLSEASVITLRPFQFLQEDDQCFVECPDPEDVLVLPVIGLNIMQLLQQGLTIGDVAQKVASEDTEDSEGYDIPDFVQTLISYGLVQAVDGTPIAS